MSELANLSTFFTYKNRLLVIAEINYWSIILSAQRSLQNLNIMNSGFWENMCIIKKKQIVEIAICKLSVLGCWPNRVSRS